MFFEFQSKGPHAVEFTSTNSDKKIVPFKDGERIIGKLLETISDHYFKIEDLNGNLGFLPVKSFHKITDPKSFSKKFVFFKQTNKILD